MAYYYRAYYCDAAGKILSGIDLEASDDADAVERSKKLAGTRFFEVWQRDCSVHRPKTAPPSADDRPPSVGRIPPGLIG